MVPILEFFGTMRHFIKKLLNRSDLIFSPFDF